MNWGEKRPHRALAHPHSRTSGERHARRKKADATITLDPGMLKKDDKMVRQSAWMTYGLIQGRLADRSICEGVSERKDVSSQFERGSAGSCGAAS